jgi:hypothetical protein
MSESLPTTDNDKIDKPWRFQPGNKRAALRRPKGFAMRDVIRKATKASDVKEVYAKLAAKAREGDAVAMKLYLAYAVGEPNQVIDLTHHVGEVDIPAAIQALLASGANLAAELQLDVEYLA